MLVSIVAEVAIAITVIGTASAETFVESIEGALTLYDA